MCNLLCYKCHTKKYKRDGSYIDCPGWTKKKKATINQKIDYGKSWTTKVGEHMPCGYSMSAIQAIDHTERKHSLYLGKDCMKESWKSLREHAKDIIDFEKKKLPLTKEELRPYKNATECYICRRISLKMFPKDKSRRKGRDHCHYTGKYRGAAHGMFNLRLNVPNKVLAVLHNGSNHDYYFIIRELAKEF